MQLVKEKRRERRFICFSELKFIWHSRYFKSVKISAKL
nr:MAG TPA: hypothetical protein [Caudoviricetes sp.]